MEFLKRKCLLCVCVCVLPGDKTSLDTTDLWNKIQLFMIENLVKLTQQ